MGCFSEVGLCIVGGIVVFVVYDPVVGDVEDLSVHCDEAGLGRLCCVGESFCVVVSAVSDGEPFVILETVIVVGIDYCVPGPGKGNPPVG